MFNIGEMIVYPMHGAGVIEAIEVKEILGEKRKYYIMKMPIGDMKAMVPIDNVEDVGVREIIDLEEMDRVLEILKGIKTSMPQNWNRRYRINMDKIKSGDIFEIAAVVRNLMLLDMLKGLSTGERKMLSNAKQMLASEMVLVLKVTIEEVDEIITNAINISEEKSIVEEEEVQRLVEEEDEAQQLEERLRLEEVEEALRLKEEQEEEEQED